MNNFALFACGLVVTLVSGMGVLVYMVTLSYDQKEGRKARPPEPDIDLGVVEPKNIKKSPLDSFVGIPSVS